MDTLKMNRIIRLTPEHPPLLFRQVAQLHAQSIHHGVLPQLGLPFLSALYAAVVRTPYGFVLVACKGSTVHGFIAGSVSMDRMYASVLLKSGWPLFKAAWTNMRQAGLWKKVWNVVCYPLRQGDSGTSCEHEGPELLAIAVSEDQRRTGLGTLLLEYFESELRRQCRCPAYSVATNIDEVISNHFYQRMGFEAIGTIAHHQLTLRLYLKKL